MLGFLPLDCCDPQMNWLNLCTANLSGKWGFYLTLSSGIQIRSCVLWFSFCVLRVLVSPLPFLLRFVDFGGFQIVTVVSRWARTCVEVFHQRKSSNSTRAHKSGLISFWRENLLLHRFSSIHGVLVCLSPWPFGGSLPTPWWILVQSCRSIQVGLVEF
jgi:hypothetical protein